MAHLLEAAVRGSELPFGFSSCQPVCRMVMTTRMMTPRTPRDEARRARTDVYRQHVFEAAEQVFAERGFEAAKLQDISRRAGLSMGTIYAIFPSKTDLFRAILEERGRELLTLARQVATPDRPPHE